MGCAGLVLPLILVDKKIGGVREWVSGEEEVGLLRPHWCADVSLAHQCDSDKFSFILLHQLAPRSSSFLQAYIRWTLGQTARG